MKKDKAIKLCIILIYGITLSFLCYLFILDGFTIGRIILFIIEIIGIIVWINIYRKEYELQVQKNEEDIKKENLSKCISTVINLIKSFDNDFLYKVTIDDNFTVKSASRLAYLDRDTSDMIKSLLIIEYEDNLYLYSLLTNEILTTEKVNDGYCYPSHLSSTTEFTAFIDNSNDPIIDLIYGYYGNLYRYRVCTIPDTFDGSLKEFREILNKEVNENEYSIVQVKNYDNRIYPEYARIKRHNLRGLKTFAHIYKGIDDLTNHIKNNGIPYGIFYCDIGHGWINIYSFDGIFLHNIRSINKADSNYDKINICTLETNP